MTFGKVGAQPSDDYMHDAGDHPNFNESVYYNFGDLSQDVGGLLRIGNRVNEGYAEVTVLVFLPGGSVAFQYVKPEIDDNQAHRSGGLDCETLEAHALHRVQYAGKVVLLADPAQMEDPRTAFKENPDTECALALTFESALPVVWPWTPSDSDDIDPQAIMLAKNHLNQHMTATGSLTIGDKEFVLREGLGWRDRSWGPRNWHDIPWYRWASCSFGPDFGLAVMVFGDQSGGRHPRGYVHHGADGDPSLIVGAQFETDYDDRWYARSVTLTVQTDKGEEYVIQGDVRGHIPLRFRRNDLTARTTEALISWRCGDRRGVGLQEYLDQIVDGSPVGAQLEHSPGTEASLRGGR